MAGNYYRMATSRTLTLISQEVTVDGISPFTWLVYEGETRTGTYNKIFESTTSSGPGSVHNSGAISASLASGRYYFIGVRTPSGSMVTKANANPRFVSFGECIAGERFYATTTPATLTFGEDSNAYSQTLTTTAP